jgi:hypothetical protein
MTGPFVFGALYVIVEPIGIGATDWTTAHSTEGQLNDKQMVSITHGLQGICHIVEAKYRAILRLVPATEIFGFELHYGTLATTYKDKVRTGCHLNIGITLGPKGRMATYRAMDRRDFVSDGLFDICDLGHTLNGYLFHGSLLVKEYRGDGLGVKGTNSLY